MLRLWRPVFYYAPSRDGAVGRKTAKQTILKSRASETRRVLLPPFTAASELRVLLGTSYETTFDLLSVKMFQKKFFWKDHEGREFETTNKRNVLVPFPIAARAVTRFGLQPQLLEVEPAFDEQVLRSKFPSPARAIVAVIGSTDHGKTTLIDALSGSEAAASEPGGITQRVRAAQAGKLTLIDTPGHKALEISRGRAVAVADVAVVVVSAAAEISECEEVLIQADRLGVPLVLAINKIDAADGEGARKALIRLCKSLHETGTTSQNLAPIAKRSILVSAKKRLNLADLTTALTEVLAHVNLPFSLPESSADFRQVRQLVREPARRTDWHTGVLEVPSAVGVVLDTVNKNDLLVALRLGNFSEGDHFACGSAYGKVRRVVKQHPEGAVMEVSGLISGSFAADDVFWVFPRQRAFRLAAYRERISSLNRVQTTGPPLASTGFELDASVLNSQEQVTRRWSEEDDAQTDFSWVPGETPDLLKLSSIYVEPDAARDTHEETVAATERPPEYERRETWTEEAETGSARVLGRQAKRDLNRMRAREAQQNLRRKEETVMEEIRAEIHGRAKLAEAKPVKPVSRPVVPVILKCDSENLFNGILDEFERLEAELDVKIPVVHGGVGNLNSEDVDHGIAERQFGFCPMYALNVGVSTVASEKAETEKIPVLRFSVFTQVVEDVERRALALKRRITDAEYREELRKRSAA